ncbi:N-methyl-L-tryptophan oxidase [Enteractinococcus coprophilus]|uniref:N-methyl-L-tryptophan oxidase n=1 Tax=Enteractinococcus coprophilus TaxID=1027633 RepID=UPI0014771EB9|nr:N-methyl-L-tryptophan oxidase [Enteractinococcus coprophilus]
MAVEHADVIVIGAGSVGSMTLWQLSQQQPDLKIVGIDAHDRVNLRSSYAGESRLFRTAVKEGPVFNDHVDASIELWRALEAATDRQILHQCGALSVGPADFEPMRTTREVVERYDLPHEMLTAAELHSRFPQFSPDPNDVGILDLLGGALRPEVAVTAAHMAAEEHGARLYFNTRVTQLRSTTDGVEVETSAGTFQAPRIIVTAGSWTTQLLPQLRSYVEVRRIGLTWAMPRHIEQFQPDVFPVFMRDRVEADGSVTHWFGAPSLDGYSIKIGVYPEPWTTTLSPEDRPADYTPEQLAHVGEMVTQCIPDLIGSPVRHSAHHDSFASNQIPIFDRLATDSRILYATGMHGNAFKFAPSYGKMLAEIAGDGTSSLWRAEFRLAAHEEL